ncbi:MAG: hypothetical protein K0R54_1198 [Clostridiaceae bacterium]|nr:hypothetical protein [Clostridiaceae bacterium]
MNMHKTIDIMYGICVNLFGYILWSVFSEFFIGTQVDYKLFLINVIGLFILYILRNKVNNKFTRIAITLSISEILFYFVLKSSFSLNLVYTAFILVTLEKVYEDSINFYYISGKMKIFMLTISIIGAAYPILISNNNKSIFRFYILFFIMAIFLLRESRNVIIKVKSKKSFIYDIFIMVLVLLLSVEKTYIFLVGLLTKVVNLIKNAYSFIEPVLDMLLEAFARIISLPLIAFFKRLVKNNVQIIDKKSDAKKVILNKSYTGIPDNIIWIAKIFFIIAGFILIYKYILRRRYKTKLLEETEEVEIEKIDKQSSGLSKDTVVNVFRNLFKNKNIKTQILEVYKAFQIRADKKGFFKKYMTATQLKNHAEAIIDEKSALNAITDLYNETKFSDHNFNEENLSEMKNSYKSIKKHL